MKLYRAWDETHTYYVRFPKNATALAYKLARRGDCIKGNGATWANIIRHGSIVLSVALVSHHC